MDAVAAAAAGSAAGLSPADGICAWLSDSPCLPLGDAACATGSLASHMRWSTAWQNHASLPTSFYTDCTNNQCPHLAETFSKREEVDILPDNYSCEAIWFVKEDISGKWYKCCGQDVGLLDNAMGRFSKWTCAPVNETSAQWGQTCFDQHTDGYNLGATGCWCGDSAECVVPGVKGEPAQWADGINLIAGRESDQELRHGGRTRKQVKLVKFVAMPFSPEACAAAEAGVTRRSSAGPAAQRVTRREAVGVRSEWTLFL